MQVTEVTEMNNFDDFFNEVLAEFRILAQEMFRDFEKQAKDDAEEFLNKVRDDLQRWADLLAKKQITEQDFSDLIKAKKALARMHRLTREGVMLTRLEQFRLSIVNILIDKIFNFPL